MATQRVPYIAEEEYLEAERKAPYKSEYFDGQVFAMSGASRWHSLISGNTFREASTALLGRCEVHGSDMRLRVPETRLYTYPDMTVVCGDPQFAGKKQDILLNPVLIVEVLSDSTEEYDRGDKFLHYKTIPSLQEYVLIAQRQPAIEQYAKVSNAEWRIVSVDGTVGRIRFSSVDVELTFDQIYRGVTFPKD